MVILQLNAQEALDVLELLIRSGHNSIAAELKNSIAAKLTSENEAEQARFRAAEVWFNRQNELIKSMKENENVGKD